MTAIVDITGRLEIRRRQAEVDRMVYKIGTDGPTITAAFAATVRGSVPVRMSMRRQFNVRIVEG